MSHSTQALDIREFISRHLAEVFETMLSKKAVPTDDASVRLAADRVCGSVGFAGENVTGVVYLQFSGAFALQAASAMLGIAVEEIGGDEETNDVVGEMTNMLGGGLKSALCNAGFQCAVSTPSIIRGSNFIVEAMPDVERIALSFNCENEPILTEVHIKYT